MSRDAVSFNCRYVGESPFRLVLAVLGFKMAFSFREYGTTSVRRYSVFTKVMIKLMTISDDFEHIYASLFERKIGRSFSM